MCYWPEEKSGEKNSVWEEYQKYKNYGVFMSTGWRLGALQTDGEIWGLACDRSAKTLLWHFLVCLLGDNHLYTTLPLCHLPCVSCIVYTQDCGCCHGNN